MRFLIASFLGLVFLGCSVPDKAEDNRWPRPEYRDSPVLPAPSTLPLVLPYVEVEAEICRSSGVWPEPSTARYTAGAEASGRRYVELPPGAGVSLTLPIEADSLVVRYSYPDTASGSGGDGHLEVTIGDRPAASLAVSSRYNWEYGPPSWGTTDVWRSPPSSGNPRHFWDEGSLRFELAPAGTVLTVTNPRLAGFTVLVDLFDVEKLAPAKAPPPGSVSLADFHPTADGVTDDTQALQAALNAAAGEILYVPEGTYRIASVDVGSASVQGAGLWRTRFVGPHSRFRFTGSSARLADFALFGETSVRNDFSDADNGFSGNPGPGSTIERVWVEHKKCAFWVGVWQNAQGPSGLHLVSCRFRNLMADAVNLCSGTRDSLVEGCLVRNTGDDGLAAWSPAGGGPSGGNNTFRANLVQAPWVANGIALYGGGPFTVEDNVVVDTVTTGSGLYVSANFGAWPFVGETTLRGNLLVRAGAHESDSGGPTGAIRVVAGDSDMTGAAFGFLNNTVLDPLESAVSIQGPWNVGNLSFEGLTVKNAPWIADVRPNAKGLARFSAVEVSGQTSGWRSLAVTNFELIHP